MILHTTGSGDLDHPQHSQYLGEPRDYTFVTLLGHIILISIAE